MTWNGLWRPKPLRCSRFEKFGQHQPRNRQSERAGIPRQWKVIQTVREKFSCRQCEAITQPPAFPTRRPSPEGWNYSSII
ncbi:hypothetical protein EN857_11495 [Mesorhizobium sp. M4B.F.Ca.ET.214.01.1.1]|nr:hypothetical protein EN857_11495 [Mesorhizobium sp. M4B.F.Ca.ET.214.01.1.1]TGQ60595.1 hypothetical protein EN854_14230 [Mesorhizobium sp. M4B.F.Ca.ET.211.01.1.1]TGU36463.1 hypothetical protein EN793_14225 [Mesorhizobium sp. M4B.F.Ca.ET.150.01.1.1]